MLRRLRSRLTYANVMATIAVFIALGGTGAYAINTIGSDDVINESLLSEDIQNQQVKTNDLALGSVFGSRIRSDAILSEHVVNNSLKGHDIDEQTFTAPLVRAFVRVDEDTCTGPVTFQTCAIERSNGVTSVKRLDFNKYCVTAPGLDADKISAAVSVDRDDFAANGAVVAMLEGTDPVCPNPETDFAVVTEGDIIEHFAGNEHSHTWEAVDGTGFQLVIP